jgi:uncharacterized damage-inducible protein DinB
MNELQHIISLLTRVYEKNAWHGPAVKEVLVKISSTDSLKRLPNTHSIIELVNHMSAWRTYTSRKLVGDNDYKVTEGMNFPRSSDWDAALRELEKSQQELISAISSFPVERLFEIVPHSTENYTFYTLLHGIIHHDLYHIGQIVLINKADVSG